MKRTFTAPANLPEDQKLRSQVRDAFRAELDRRGLGTTEAGELSGVDARTIRRIRAGGPMTFELVDQIATSLGLRVRLVLEPLEPPVVAGPVEGLEEAIRDLPWTAPEPEPRSGGILPSEALSSSLRLLPDPPAPRRRWGPEVDLERRDLGRCTCGHGHGFTRCPNTGSVSVACHVPGCSCAGFEQVEPSPAP